MNPYATGVLKPEVHDRLVAGLPKYAEMAGIPQDMICTPMSEHCSPEEIDWVRKFRQHTYNGQRGLVYTATAAKRETRIMCVVGALVRNFVDARLLSVYEVSNRMRDGEELHYGCLAIPDFHVSGVKGGFRAQDMMGLLISRAAAGRQTILGIGKEEDACIQYGSFLKEHLQKYQAITA